MSRYLNRSLPSAPCARLTRSQATLWQHRLCLSKGCQHTFEERITGYSIFRWILISGDNIPAVFAFLKYSFFVKLVPETIWENESNVKSKALGIWKKRNYCQVSVLNKGPFIHDGTQTQNWTPLPPSVPLKWPNYLQLYTVSQEYLPSSLIAWRHLWIPPKLAEPYRDPKAPEAHKIKLAFPLLSPEELYNF